MRRSLVRWAEWGRRCHVQGVVALGAARTTVAASVPFSVVTGIGDPGAPCAGSCSTSRITALVAGTRSLRPHRRRCSGRSRCRGVARSSCLRVHEAVHPFYDVVDSLPRCALDPLFKCSVVACAPMACYPTCAGVVRAYAGAW